MIKVPQVRTGQVGKAVAKTQDAPKLPKRKGAGGLGKLMAKTVLRPAMGSKPKRPAASAANPVTPTATAKPINKMSVRRDPIKSVGTKLSRLARR